MVDDGNVREQPSDRRRQLRQTVDIQVALLVLVVAATSDHRRQSFAVVVADAAQRRHHLPAAGTDERSRRPALAQEEQRGKRHSGGDEVKEQPSRHLGVISAARAARGPSTYRDPNTGVTLVSHDSTAPDSSSGAEQSFTSGQQYGRQRIGPRVIDVGQFPRAGSARHQQTAVVRF